MTIQITDDTFRDVMLLILYIVVLIQAIRIENLKDKIKKL